MENIGNDFGKRLEDPKYKVSEMRLEVEVDGKLWESVNVDAFCKNSS